MSDDRDHDDPEHRRLDREPDEPDERDARELQDLRDEIERGAHGLRDEIERKARAYGHEAEDRQWEKVERAWRRHVEHRERREARRAQMHERWQQRRHRRWKELQDEREMWLRMRKDKRGWGPWWLQARMRKRIFIWLAFAFMSGAFAMNYWESARWWHAIVALLGLSVMSGAIAFRLTRPLIMVIRAARDIGDGKLETRLDVDRHRGETRLLAMAINDMAERIEQQIKDQRQLLAAVSHELRTPLGHMRVLIDTARAANDRKALGELECEVLVLDDLVGRLLASSRLEFGNLDCRPLDLGALVTDVATAAGVAPEAIEAIGDVRASVDPTLVRRAVANLLDNARVHGGGAVAVRIERRARQVAIEVDDAGPGVPADRRADAFRAFVPSHNGGLGLGLALVSRIAVAHGGGAWITDRPGGGTRVGFTVELAPRAAGS
ncbi:MAG TPA: HAMP domain-containing sensor histidine kinase [Kofleriaceae bacterium]|nr:HAMP domain-containing sensor histidine kinase [Kofleriaceae bacterium]